MKKQELQQISAYDKKVVHDMFVMTMEWLEKYIETIGCYSDWENRKQIHENNIKRKDIIGNPEKVKSSFSTVLFILETNLQDMPPMFREEIKQEFYKWVSAVGINVDNCRSDELKTVLYQVNEILEGRGEKLRADLVNRKREIEMDSPEYMDRFKNIFASVQDPMRKEKEVEKTWKNKSDKDWEKESKFSVGNAEQGEKNFGEISREVASESNNFYFFPQKDQQLITSAGSTHPDGLWVNFDEIIQDIKTNLQNWRVDEIATEINNYGETKQEILLVNLNARLDEYIEGKLNFNNNPIYLWENFNSQQRFEIKQAKKITGEYLTDEEIRWVVREVKENPRIWKVGKIDGQTYLIHGSAQIKREEIGTLLHNQQKFNEAEWVEINGAFERAIVIDEIKQNAKIERLFVLNRETGEVSENEDWFIHNQLKRDFDKETGYLIYVPNLMIRAKDLTEVEQKELNYNKLENTQQVQSQNRSSSGKGGLGNIIIWGSFTVISLIGLAFTKNTKK